VGKAKAGGAGVLLPGGRLRRGERKGFLSVELAASILRRFAEGSGVEGGFDILMRWWWSDCLRRTRWV